MTNEYFKPVVGYEGLYEVSNLGRVKSLYLKGKRRDKIMHPQANIKYTYLQITLRKNGVRKKFPVHRLVAKAFIPPIPDKPFVNHIDCNKQNNNVENLEWCNNQENIQHSFIYGDRKVTKIRNVQTGQTFKGYDKAGKSIGVSGVAVREAIKRNRIIQGCKFERIEE